MPTGRETALGMWEDEYADLLESQGGGCAICGRPPKTRRLHVDHDHKTGAVRGLLCFRCNRALPSWVTWRWNIAAAAYLAGPRSMRGWPMVDLTKLDATNAVLQKDTKAAVSVKHAHQAAVDVLHAMNPPAPVQAMRLAWDTRQGAGWAQCQANGFNTLFAGLDTALLAQLKAAGCKAILNLSGSIGQGPAVWMPYARQGAASGALAAICTADEPDPGQASMLKAARATLAADPATAGIQTFITYYDASTIGQMKGCADLFGLDAYPSRNNWDYSVITNLAAAADTAGLTYIVVLGAFQDLPNYPLPTQAQYANMVFVARQTKQVGQGTYSFGITPNALENQPALLAAVKAGNA